jgi:hypothetical protein
VLCLIIAGAVPLLGARSSVAQEFSECGFLLPADGAWEDVQDCLLFESDTGTVYQLETTNIDYTPGYRARVRSWSPEGCQATCPGAEGCINNAYVDPCFATMGHFTTAEDFRQGEFINLNGVGDQLQVNTWEQTRTAEPPVLPYLWVACSSRGTVVRIATARHYSPIHARAVEVGEVLGEYRTAP